MIDVRNAPNFLDLIKQAERDLEQIKNPQFAGADNLRLYAYANLLAPYDNTFTLGSGGHIFSTIDFTSGNQENALVEMTWEVYMDGLTPAHRIRPGIQGWGDAFVVHLIPTPNNPMVNRWTVEFWNYDFVSHTYYWKYHFLSTDRTDAVI